MIGTPLLLEWRGFLWRAVSSGRLLLPLNDSRPFSASRLRSTQAPSEMLFSDRIPVEGPTIPMNSALAFRNLIPILAIALTCSIPSTAMSGEVREVTFHFLTGDHSPEGDKADILPAEATYEPAPWLSSSDIREWAVTGDAIYIRLKTPREQVLRRIAPVFESEESGPFRYKPFVILFNGEPCLIGEFSSLVHSFASKHFRIDSTELFRDDRNEWELVLRPPWSRRQWPPLECLAPVLGEILHTRADDLVIMTSDVRVKGTEAPPALLVECDIELRNVGEDDLLVLDPGRIRPGFSGYVAALKIATSDKGSGRVQQRTVMARWDEEFDEQWLVRLTAGGVLRATIKQKTKRLSPGAYSCIIQYPGVSNIGRLVQRDLASAWIWTDEVVSDAFRFEIND